MIHEREGCNFNENFRGNEFIGGIVFACDSISNHVELGENNGRMKSYPHSDSWEGDFKVLERDVDGLPIFNNHFLNFGGINGVVF